VRESPYRIPQQRPRPPRPDPEKPILVAALAVAVLAPTSIWAARSDSWFGGMMVVTGVCIAAGLLSWRR
jgi:hypothetical protein